ncbi:MAG: pyridoxamine 5'-phosphate oxidase [Bacteroidota bacterium]|jgi:pyridoxamine 5'-phosphate oxidase
MSELSSHIEKLRVDYSLKRFDEADVNADPFLQFEQWLHEAIQAEVNEPNAMVLSTIKPDLSPSSRAVLLKGFSRNGLIFYTNYESNKAKQISHNNRVALNFLWLELQRQVRVEGIVTTLNDEENDRYFVSRPTGSQIGAHASPQSTVVQNREELERRFSEFEALFSQKAIVRPRHWGGFVVIPHLFEFWQGRENRLHDRFQYQQIKDGWQIDRLAP